MTPSTTIAYWLCGAAYAETLAVSAYHLRKHWQGNVTLCYCPKDKTNVEAAKRLAQHFAMQLVEIPVLPFRRHRHYVTKSTLWRHIPHDQVVLIDADTLPVRPIDSLFDDRITVTAFANWVTTGKIIGGRLRSAIKHLDEAKVIYPLPLKQWPAINTGVIGWDRERCHVDLESWEALCMKGHKAPFTDELMMQLLLSTLDAKLRLRLVDDRWNLSPTHGVNREHVAIWHFHGRRHVRKKEGQAIWQPAAREAIASVPGLADWWGRHDPAVSHLKDSR